MSSSTKNKSLLVQLSVACQKHRVQHHSHPNGEEEHSEECQKDLKALSVVIPKVEAEYLRSTEIAHLCDFYNDAINGGFCPHAPKLFRTGIDDSFKRIVSLVENLVSKRVLQASIKSDYIVDKLCSTVARLLSFEANLVDSIGKDLVNLCMDLAIVQEAKLFETNDTLRVVLFSETVGSSDYFVEVPNAEAACALQVAGIKLVHEFALHHMYDRLGDSFDSSRPRRNVDALWRSDNMATLLASLRQVLLSPLPQSAKMTTFALRARSCAFQLLESIVAQWEQFGISMYRDETALLISRAVHWFFSCSERDDEIRMQLAAVLNKLVRSAVLVGPPMKGGVNTLSSRSQALLSLLDCIPNMERCALMEQGLDADLCYTLLSTIEVFIKEDLALLETAMHHCTTNSIFPQMFGLLSTSSTPIRGVVVQILHSFLEINGCQRVILASACRFAEHSIGPPQQRNQTERKPLKTQNRTPPGSARRKRVAGGTNRSPRKLVLEPSPKRRRTSRATDAAPASEVAKAAMPMPETPFKCSPSLADSLRLFFFQSIQNSREVASLCREKPSGSNPASQQNLRHRLQGCTSALFLLLPELIQEPEECISKVVAELTDALSLVSAAIATAWQEFAHNRNESEERLVQHTEALVDAGLMCHTSLLRSSRRVGLEDSLVEFLISCSRCVWDALACYPSVAKSSTPWKGCCRQCCCMMRFLNIRETDSTMCACLATPRGESHVPENSVVVSGWPLEVKLVAFAFANPPLESPLTSEKAETELPRACRPSIQKCEEIIRRLLSGTDMSLFAVAFLALLPSLVLSWTRDLVHQTKEEEISMEKIFQASCAAFPHKAILKILGKKDVSPEMRKGAMLGVHHFRSLIRATKWKVDTSAQRGTCAPQLAFFFSLCPTSLADQSHREPHHGLSALDRELRLSLLSVSFISEDTMPPDDRIQKWRIVKCAVLQESPVELQSMPKSQSEPEDTSFNPPEILTYMISAPFADNDYTTRLTLSRELGEFLLFRGGHVLQAMFGGDDRRYRGTEGNSESGDLILAQLFHQIDRLLVSYGRMPRSQMPSTFTTPSRPDASQSIEPLEVEYQYTALRTLASLCQFAKYDDPQGRVLLENSLLRMVRIWATLDHSGGGNEVNGARVSLSSLSFVEIRRLSSICDFTYLSSGTSQRRLLPLLVCEVLEPATASLQIDSGRKALGQDLRQRQNRLLYAFLESFVLTDLSEITNLGANDSRLQHMRPNLGSPFLVANFLDDCLRFAIPLMVVEKDYDSMRLAAGFKLFVLGLHTSSSSNRSKDIILGMSIRTRTTRAFGTTKTRISLEEHTKNLCLQSEMIEHILPRLLMGDYNDRSQVVFFLEVALQSEMSLQKLVAKSDRILLKGLIWELGGWTHVGKSAIQAVEMAALARESSLREAQNTEHADSTMIASQWVSSHFMFLLVNIVQTKWREKSLDDKIKALKSLNLMLAFLLPSEAPQFLTQMVATVSMAASLEIPLSASSLNRVQFWLLRKLAAQNLASYSKTLLNGHVEMIGRNLASIVVSLFPILVHNEDEDEDTEDAAIERIRTEAGRVAAGILDMFTSKKVGKELAHFFNEVPFLPTTPLLERTRENLKRNGVVFDNLAVLSSSETTQRVLSGRDSMTSDGGTTEKEGRLDRLNERLLPLLQKRLRIVCPLVSHESASVRLRTLNHLTDLLRANRVLFYRLLDKESSTATTLTVYYPNVEYEGNGGSIASLVQALLKRASSENNRKLKAALGTCLGEVAAIDPHRVGRMSTSNDWYQNKATNSTDDRQSWQLSQPPWRSSIHKYALHLLTKQLANALKATSNSAELHKIAFTIQQMLVILDNRKLPEDSSMYVENRDAQIKSSGGKREPMSGWLRNELKEAGVLDILEPYWATSFSEIDSKIQRNPKHQPPFFQSSDTYFSWISRWCRYMILRSSENSSCEWRGFLYACRTAVRSLAGIVVSEFILPILVLERLCFGSPNDEAVILQELQDVFDTTMEAGLSSGDAVQMSFNERQKAVNAAFLLVDILKQWGEREVESKHNAKKHAGSQASIPIASGSWNASRSMEKITDMLRSVSLDAMSKSAVSMGMHARALLCLETKARADLAASVYDTTKAASVAKGRESGTNVSARHGLGSPLLNGIDLRGLKDVLGKLDDYPTIRAVNGKSGSPLYDNDSIRERESRSDWVGALSDYERALQSQTNASSRSRLQHAYLHCLLQIGQYESVLNQVDGIIHRAKATSRSVGEEDINRAIPMGIDAAWRLGRWSVLDSLVKEYDSREWGGHSPVDFQLAVGKAMLGLHRQSKQEVESALRFARDAVMAKLSTFARDSYERAYPSLVNLHCLREIEDASILLNSHEAVPGLGWGNLSDMANSDDVGGWAWDCRLEIASSTDSSRITDVRLALARLAGDSRLEGKLLFVMGKKARKNALLDVASTCFAQSHAVFEGLSKTDPYGNKSIEWIGDIQMQFAKLQYQTGQSGSALRILGVEDLKGWSKLSHDEVQQKAATTLQAITGSPTPRADKSVLQDMAKRLLKSTRWIADGGLKAVPEVMERFRVTNQLWPKWEKSHFEFGKYVDSILDSRISGVAQHEGWSADDDFIRHYALTEDMNCQNYLLMAMEQYLEALKISGKHVYQALPRLLSLWFEYTSVQRNASKRGSKARRQGEESPLNVSSDPSGFLQRKQDEANEMFQKSASSISSSMFYTATPQLISRVCHPNGDTALAVQALLTRILTKFPGQAMWELAWVRNSLDKKRSNIGHQIFKSAQKSILGWASSDRRGESKRKIFEKNQKILAASQSFVKYFIDIAKYTPKDERARTFKLSKWRGEVDLSDFIPPVQTALASPFDSTRHGRDPFPRFRAMHETVQIMSSKAKPKRVKFYVIPGGSRSMDSNAKPGSEDVGELHFLLKNEVKGDLRKDARVQDLNNVINRLVVNSGKGRRQRRLQLRTFAVTCLSEDCGSVEWVPNTDSFRNLASRSYNPQAATYSAKRRGKRIANFGDPNLKKNYESCQGHFFKHGDLTSAARLFETHFLNAFPPLFYWWFVQTFMDPHAWYEARTNFTYSSAVWSAVGHVIGLGDRHSENLLIDTSSGSCVHVDFDCIFDKGLTLPKPEIIPFRLTSNMVDAFGPVGADGMYSESLKAAMSVLRDNRDTLLSVLEPFVKDPIIDWKKNSSSQRQSGSAGVRDTKQAKRSIKVIDERLRGIYNLHNPNFKKVKRTDQVAVDNDEEMAQIVPLSVDGQVHKMISEATSHENLIQLYIGWMPWI